MNEQLTELLNTLYEAEGLVEMALRRKVVTPDRITRLALEKCYHVARLAGEIKLPDTEETADEERELPVYDTASEPAPEVAGEDEVLEEKEVEVFTDEILPQMNLAAPKTDILDGSIFDSEDEPEESQRFENKAADDAEVAEVADDAEVADAEYAPDSEPAAFEPAPATYEPAPAPASPRKPIIGFFSINDKFRFRRGLMAGNDAAFRELLGCLETMADLEEARTYIFSELDWDPENPDVKSFISILDRYYK